MGGPACSASLASWSRRGGSLSRRSRTGRPRFARSTRSSAVRCSGATPRRELWPEQPRYQDGRARAGDDHLTAGWDCAVGAVAQGPPRFSRPTAPPPAPARRAMCSPRARRHLRCPGMLPTPPTPSSPHAVAYRHPRRPPIPSSPQIADPVIPACRWRGPMAVPSHPLHPLLGDRAWLDGGPVGRASRRFTC